MIMHRYHMDLSMDGPLAQSMFICFYSLKRLAGPIKMWLRAIHSCGVFYSVVCSPCFLWNRGVFQDSGGCWL